MRIPTTVEVAAVLDAAEPWFGNYIRVCAFAGLRLAEAIALQLPDVEFMRRSIGVHRQLQHVSGELLVTPPKHGSERDVFAAEELLTDLARHVSDIGVTGDKHWLFAGLAAPTRSAVNSRWVKTIAAAGVRPFTLRDLRHFYASGLIAAGCDVVTVQRALGHSSASITLSTYSHLWPDAGTVPARPPLDCSARFLRTPRGLNGPNSAQRPGSRRPASVQDELR